MAVTIDSLQLENVKRVKAFTLSPGAHGLTIIGGNNGNGKTSVLDGIAWLLGGGKYQPSSAQREGSLNSPALSATLSNGLVVERKGKNASLTVTDPNGKKHGQALLDSFVSTFALDLPKFMNSNDKDKAQILLQILGIGPELLKLEQEQQALYNERHTIGQIKVSKTKHAEELPEYADAPAEPVSVSEMIQQQQAILAKNGENQRLRERKGQLENSLAGCRGMIRDLETQLATLNEKLGSQRDQEALIVRDIETATKSAEQLVDESTAEIETSLANIESINAQVAANQAKARAADEAAQYEAQYNALSVKLDAVRDQRLKLLNDATLPLPDLTVEEGILKYRGKAWDCMSGSEQLRVAVAIVRCLTPECGFVLIDKLEQFDLTTLEEFGAWLVEQNLQAIATRVSTGEECTIIIEDGLPAGQTYVETVTETKPWGEWK